MEYPFPNCKLCDKPPCIDQEYIKSKIDRYWIFGCNCNENNEGLFCDHVRDETVAMWIKWATKELTYEVQ